MVHTVLCLHGHIGMSVFKCHWRGHLNEALFDRQNTACSCFGIVSDLFRLFVNSVICAVIDILAGLRSDVHLVFDVSDDCDEGILERSMTTGCTPIPRIAIQEEKDDFFRKEFGKALADIGLMSYQCINMTKLRPSGCVQTR